jgi:O-acetyl-ADP-ribose deacetylase (regulator of RNase III)
MIIKQMNILDVTKGIIVHQCNAQGVMGAGLAAKIRARYPVAYDIYRNKYLGDACELGSISCAFACNYELIIVNLIGQKFYGWDKNVIYTDYEAFRNGCKKIKNLSDEQKDWPVYFPFNIGCGLANGSWNIVSKIIEEELPNAIVCKL